MKKVTKKKLIDFLFEISPKEEREVLVLKQTGDFAKDIEMISKAVVELDEKHSKSQDHLIHSVNTSIVGLKEEFSTQIGEQKDSILQEIHQKLLELYGTYEKSIGDKSNNVSKEIKGEIKIELDKLSKEVSRISDMAPKMWGGSSRTLYLNGNTMSPENLYSDVNFIPGPGVSIIPVNNENTLRVDVTISVTGGVPGMTPIFGEIVSGSSTSWTLANTPSGTILLVANGQVLLLGDDYSMTGVNITTVQPWSAGTVQASYNY